MNNDFGHNWFYTKIENGNLLMRLNMLVALMAIYAEVDIIIDVNLGLVSKVMF
ncbi:MAG: hypothetical protein IPO27_14445 [Bacteroidetes bacterium]|nr:hypothetical protein [Bacteroidota bacterium]